MARRRWTQQQWWDWQEGSDATAERDTGGRRAGGSRRARVEESESIDIQQLQLFWNANFQPRKEESQMNLIMSNSGKG